MISVKPVLLILAYLAATVGVLPVLPYLDLPVQLTLGGGFVIGLIGERRRRHLLGDKLATLPAIAFLVVFISQASMTNLVTPLINFLCLLLAIRLAGAKSARHLLQIFLLATIILAASSMLTLNLAYLAYLILIILLVTSGLVLLTFYTTATEIRLSRRDWKLLVKTIVLLPVGSLLLMLLLFVVLPRTPTPLWNFLNPRPPVTTGMSDQVRPGSVAELSRSDKTAFRAETGRLPAENLYWRGLVLDQMLGNVWVQSSYTARETLIPAPQSEVDITIYSEPKADRYLVSLDRPLKVSGVNHRLTTDGVITVRSKNSKIRYQLQVQFHARSRQQGEASHYLKLPPVRSERLAQVAERINQEDGFEAKRTKLDQFFLQQKLNYSAQQLPISQTPVETFLFESRRGYCEYFATAYALLLRMGGIPARLVGGYLGGEFNQLGSYYLVKEDAAHVWVEALDDEGIWQRIDPSRLAQNANAAFSRPAADRLANLRALGDAIGHYWSQMVLNYDLRQQFNLLRSLVRKTRELKTPQAWPIQSLWWCLGLLLPFAAYGLMKRYKSRTERILKRYRQLMAVVAGIESLPASEGLYTLADRCPHPLCRDFAEIYGAAVYRDKPLSGEEIKRLKEIVRQLRLEHRKPPFLKTLSGSQRGGFR